MSQIVVDLYEPAPTDEEKASEEAKEGDSAHKIRDMLLSDLRMFRQMRTTKWAEP